MERDILLMKQEMARLHIQIGNLMLHAAEIEKENQELKGALRQNSEPSVDSESR